MKKKSKPLKWTIYLLVLIIPLVLFAAATASGSGDWDSTAIWASSNIGDGGETVTFNNNIGEVIVRSGFNYTVGAMDIRQGNTLTINGTLSVGDASNPNDLITGNTSTISVGNSGALTIWGDLNAGNNLTIGLGTLTIKGDLIMDNNATISITGTVQIDGNFIAGTNADVTIASGGDLNVDGFFDVGNGSTMGGTGIVTGDPCTGPDAFCINSPLPVDLVSFSVTSFSNRIDLEWETASELNNDYFDVLRSENGKDFYEIGQIVGNGTSNQPHSYSFIDYSPIVNLEYYRLKQVDFDGTFKYYPIQVATVNEFERTIEITMYPNPVTDKVTLMSNRPIQFARLELLNLTGQVVNNLMNSTQVNGLKTEIFLPQLNSGFFYITYVTAEGDSGTQKLLVK